MATDAIPRLQSASSLVLVIDVQDKLLAAMPDAGRLVRNIRFLLEVARLLEVPIRATEQYPKGLGPTTSEVRQRLPESLQIPAKTRFSCQGIVGLLNSWSDPAASGACDTGAGDPSAPGAIVVCGIESHVCVLQTVLDFRAVGLPVFIPVDAMASRGMLDHELAIRRMERAGAVATTVETIAFEWLGDASHPQFKAISRLVVERASAS
jgi:nicotinamidase-related amidase